MRGINDLGNGIYCINGSRRIRLFPAHTYLIKSGVHGAIIDPGPREDFPAVYSYLMSEIPLEQVSYLIITSELPDACSSLPLWERTGFRGKILVHWNAFFSAQYYGWGSELYTLSKSDETIAFGENRQLRLLNIPGIPTSGSIVCFDELSGSLFSGMPFGSIGGNEADEDEESWGRIESFHDLFFSHLGTRDDIYNTLSGLNPKKIYPRHGPPVVEYLHDTLSLLSDRKDNTPGSTGRGSENIYGQIISEANRRLADLFSEEELKEALSKSGIEFDENLYPVFDGPDMRESFEGYFESILRARGVLWLSLIKALVIRKLDSRGILPPRVFARHAQEIERGIGGLMHEVRKLKSENIELQKSIIQASDDQLKDPVTGFYNEVFFEEYLDSLLPPDTETKLPDDSVAFVRLDGIKQLNQRFGAKTGDNTLKGLGYFLLNRKKPNTIFFRMNGPLFACYIQGGTKEQAIEYAAELKEQVEKSDQFVDKITISAAIVDFSEMKTSQISSGKIYNSLMKVAKERLKFLDKLGPSSICSESNITLRRTSGTVLLIESNQFEADLFLRILEREGFEVHAVTNGGEAITQADLHRPDVIISEIYIAQMDGFQIRQRLRSSPDLKGIPFILMSREKSEASVQRALDLKIQHYFKKPVLATEMAGIIKLLIGEAETERHS